MQSISVIIITKNEAHNIKSCIESVLWADEIIILDSGSTDGTQNICREYAKANLYETDWPGFGIQKQRALDLAHSDWILSLDADEIITVALKDEIQKIIVRNNETKYAYKIPRQTFFLGKPIKFSYKPKNDAPIRLFQRGCGKFTEDTIHEKFNVATELLSEVGCLKNHILHHSFPDVDTLLRKIQQYSTLGAGKISKQKSCNSFSAFSHAFWVFFKFYILKCGFLDGFPGFLIAFSNFEGTLYRYVKSSIRHLERSSLSS